MRILSDNSKAANEYSNKTAIIETVVLLRDKKVDGHISVKLDADKLNLKSGKAIYDDIKAYVR